MNRLEPQTGAGFRLRAGDLLTVVDPTGGQVSDFFALSAADHGEWLSSGRSIDYANTIYLSTGHVLYSNRSRPMATIVADTCGRHDFLLTPCSQQTFDLLYPRVPRCPTPQLLGESVLGPRAVRGRPRPDLHHVQHLHERVDRPHRRAAHRPTHLRRRRPLVLRAEMDLHVGLTACSAEKSNGGVCKPIDYQVTRG